MDQPAYPDGKRFAFTIMDDTDVATEANVRPIYRLLADLGMRTTKTVWPVSCPEGSRDFSDSETLEDESYRAFAVQLSEEGFEIASHGATMESSTRPRTLRAMERFHEVFGHYPRVYANHALNRENLYWGPDRVDHPLLRPLYAWSLREPRDYYRGHDPESEFWWGDVAQRHIEYIRNLTFNEVNLLRVNPTMPYRDPARPLGNWWFSSTDAESVVEFRELITPARQERLEREGGVCIVATHLGKGFVRDGRVDPVVEARLRELAGRSGWFVPVGDLLDWMRSRHGRETLPPREWRRMQWTWARDLAARRLGRLPGLPSRKGRGS